MGESQSITTQPQTPTEPSAPCSSVEIQWRHPDSLSPIDWEWVERMLDTVLSRGRVGGDLPETLERIASCDSGLWVLIDESGQRVGLVVCKVVRIDPDWRVFLVELAAADGVRISAAGWRGVIGHLEELAMAMQADAIRVVGRRGWARILTDYEETSRTFDKVYREKE